MIDSASFDASPQFHGQQPSRRCPLFASWFASSPRTICPARSVEFQQGQIKMSINTCDRWTDPWCTHQVSSLVYEWFDDAFSFFLHLTNIVIHFYFSLHHPLLLLPLHRWNIDALRSHADWISYSHAIFLTGRNLMKLHQVCLCIIASFFVAFHQSTHHPAQHLLSKRARSKHWCSTVLIALFVVSCACSQIVSTSRCLMLHLSPVPVTPHSRWTCYSSSTLVHWLTIVVWRHCCWLSVWREWFRRYVVVGVQMKVQWIPMVHHRMSLLLSQL